MINAADLSTSNGGQRTIPQRYSAWGRVDIMFQQIEGMGQTLAISSDGSTVLGLAYDGGGFCGIRWTRNQGVARLDLEPRGISCDGRVIVGVTLGQSRTLLWTEGKGVQEIGRFDQPRAVSGDGGMIVGSHEFRAVCWSREAGIVRLPLPQRRGNWLSSEATAVTRDGSVIVGWIDERETTTKRRAVRWHRGRPASIMQWGGGYYYVHYDAIPTAVSADGSTVVGYSEMGAGDGKPNEAWRWRAGLIFSGSMKAIGQLLSARESLAFKSRYTGQRGDSASGITFNTRALGVSANGDVVVGYGTEAPGLRPTTVQSAFAWTPRLGMLGLSDFLKRVGADVPDLAEACGVSGDGKTIIGNGPKSWMVTLPTSLTMRPRAA